MNDNFVEIQVGVGLGDSELISYTYTEESGKLILLIKTWNAKTLEISFEYPVLFVSEGYGLVEYFCENKDKTNKLLVEAVKKLDEDPWQGNSYKLFQFVERDYEPTMQIIAENFHYKILEDK